MRTKNVVLTLMASLLILSAGCVGVPPAVSRPDTRPRAPAGLRYREDGSLLHVYSKAVFPPKTGEWVMFDAVKYDEPGRDVSVGYGRRWGDYLARADIYVYPTYAGEVNPALLRSHYQKVKSDVFAYKQQVTLLAEQEGTWSLPSGDQFCISAVFDLKMDGKRMTSYVFLFGRNEWYILWRISHPLSANTHEVPQAVSSLIESIDYSVIE